MVHKTLSIIILFCICVSHAFAQDAPKEPPAVMNVHQIKKPVSRPKPVDAKLFPFIMEAQEASISAAAARLKLQAAELGLANIKIVEWEEYFSRYVGTAAVETK